MYRKNPRLRYVLYLMEPVEEQDTKEAHNTYNSPASSDVDNGDGGSRVFFSIFKRWFSFR